MDFSNTLTNIVSIACAISMVLVVVVAIYDSIFGKYEDWYDFDEIVGHAVGLKSDFPIEHEFTGWKMLVHVVDEKGHTQVYKTSTLLYRILKEEKKYHFFIRDNAIWKVIEADTKLTFKAKWSFGG